MSRATFGFALGTVILGFVVVGCGAATTPNSTPATPSATVVAPAKVSATAVPTATPTDTPTPTAIPTATPSASCIPGYATNLCPSDATPTPAATTPLFSTTDCSWAEGVIAEDESLDSQEAQALTDGTDTRYPASDAGYYQGEADEWAQIDAWMTSMCGGQPVNGTDVQTALTWIRAAEATHVADEQAVPADAAWDDAWIANYTRLAALLQQVS